MCDQGLGVAQHRHAEPMAQADGGATWSPRELLRSLIDQRSLINAHIDGRDRSFPTALLDLDEDEEPPPDDRPSGGAGGNGSGRPALKRIK